MRIGRSASRVPLIGARQVGLLIISGLVVASCSSSTGSKPRSSSTTRRSTTTSSTDAPSSTSTSLPTTTSTIPCPTAGAMTDVRDSFPDRMSSMTGRDVRSGVHGCFERFVIELQTPDQPVPAFPGYWVRYATGPVELSPAGQQITMRGTASLLVSMGAAMKWTNPVGYDGPHDVFPPGMSMIEEYRLIEDFEGQSTWALGLDRKRNFEVTQLPNPPRLVVDIHRTP